MGVRRSKLFAPSRHHGVQPVYGFDAGEAVVALRLLRRADLPQHEVAGAEHVAAHLGLRDVGVGLAPRSAVVAEEAVAVRQHFQDAACELVALALRPGREDLVEDAVPGLGRRALPAPAPSL